MVTKIEFTPLSDSKMYPFNGGFKKIRTARPQNIQNRKNKESKTGKIKDATAQESETFTKKYNYIPYKIN